MCIRDRERAFPGVFAQGGFDAVIGNPPYGVDFSNEDRMYLRKFEISTTESAAMFMVHSEKITCGGGFNGLIIPKPFLFSSSWEKTRNKLLPNIVGISDVGRGWENVLLEQVIYFLNKGLVTSYFDSCKRKLTSFEFITEVDKTDCEKFGFIINDL